MDRLQIQQVLSGIAGVKKAYWQAPSKDQMVYPAIKYELDDHDNGYADNMPYRTAKRYQVVVIDRNPDSLIPDLVAKLPYCSFDRFYAADGLNHFSFNIYF